MIRITSDLLLNSQESKLLIIFNTRLILEKTNFSEDNIVNLGIKITKIHMEIRSLSLIQEAKQDVVSNQQLYGTNEEIKLLKSVSNPVAYNTQNVDIPEKFSSLLSQQHKNSISGLSSKNLLGVSPETKVTQLPFHKNSFNNIRDVNNNYSAQQLKNIQTTSQYSALFGNNSLNYFNLIDNGYSQNQGIESYSNQYNYCISEFFYNSCNFFIFNSQSHIHVEKGLSVSIIMLNIK